MREGPISAGVRQTEADESQMGEREEKRRALAGSPHAGEMRAAAQMFRGAWPPIHGAAPQCRRA